MKAFYPTADNLEKILRKLDVLVCDIFGFEHHKSQEELKAEILKMIEDNEKQHTHIF